MIRWSEIVKPINKKLQESPWKPGAQQWQSSKTPLVCYFLVFWEFTRSAPLPCFLAFVWLGPRRGLPVAQRWPWWRGLWEAGGAAERLCEPTGPSGHSIHSVCNKVSLWSLLARACSVLLGSFCSSFLGLPANQVMIHPNYPGSPWADFYPLLCLLVLASWDEKAEWGQDLTASWC